MSTLIWDLEMVQFHEDVLIVSYQKDDIHIEIELEVDPYELAYRDGKCIGGNGWDSPYEYEQMVDLEASEWENQIHENNILDLVLRAKKISYARKTSQLH